MHEQANSVRETVSLEGWVSFKAFSFRMKKEPDQFEEAKIICLLKIELWIKTWRTSLFLQINLSLNSSKSAPCESHVTAVQGKSQKILSYLWIWLCSSLQQKEVKYIRIEKKIFWQVCLPGSNNLSFCQEKREFCKSFRCPKTIGLYLISCKIQIKMK